MIIDFHTHAFPDTLAPRAMETLTANAAVCGYTAHTNGTVAGLLASMDKAGVDRSVICNIATNARQMRKVNDFAIETAQTQPRLIPLGSLHPGATRDELEAEVTRIKAAGLPGVKIHPDYVGIEIDAPAFAPILALCEAENLFVITHAGYDPVAPDHVHATPAMLKTVLDRYPRLRLVAAHTGGFDRESEVLKTLVGTRIYLDTSLSAIRHGRSAEWGEACAEIIRRHDPARVLFATDTPWSLPAEELAFLEGLRLPADTLDAIFHGNAERLIAGQE